MRIFSIALKAPARAAVVCALTGLGFALAPPGAHAAGRNGHGAGGVARARRGEPAADRLGAAVLAFAESEVGRQVGSGECFDLADQALHAAGARSAPDFAAVSPSDDYVWGRRVALSAVQPGDILQFRGYRVTRRMTSMLRGEDGSFQSEQSMAAEEREHHTAIVEQAGPGSLVVLEQNMDPAGRVVSRNRVDTAPHTERTGDAAQGGETVTETEVEGEVLAYRPVSAAPYQTANASP